MSNIHNITSQGSGLTLGPVTIKKTFEKKPGDTSRFLIVTDATGESPLKIWGAAANTHVVEGQLITLTGQGPRGGLSNKEYPPGSNKWSINANDCRLSIQGGQQAAQEAYEEPYVQSGAQPAQRSPQGSPPSSASINEIARQCARFTAAYIDNLVVNHGYSKDEAIMLAQNSPSWVPLWWFGEKGMTL